jgi:NAD(P)-dependent dehydrogenase (short-subunit alcohol dehydrogenase family)
MSRGTIVVTGASSGFGRAIAEEFAARGWNVAATVRRPEEHQRLFAALPSVRLFQLDVTDEGQVGRLAADVVAAYGGVDVLVNNAGALLMGPLETSAPAQIRAQYETHVFGPIALTRALLPQMRARRAGMIINIASAGARAGYPFLAAYGSSKAALASLSESLAVELAPFGVKVKVLLPGVHATKIFTKVADGLTGGEAAAAYRPNQANFLAVQDGVAEVAPARRVARLVARIVEADDDRVSYVVGRDAALMDLLKALLPQGLYKRAMAASITRAPSRAALRLLSRLMGGTERVEVDRGDLGGGREV